jgi:hypothetical protein
MILADISRLRDVFVGSSSPITYICRQLAYDLVPLASNLLFVENRQKPVLSILQTMEGLISDVKAKKIDLFATAADSNVAVINEVLATLSGLAESKLEQDIAKKKIPASEKANLMQFLTSTSCHGEHCSRMAGMITNSTVVSPGPIEGGCKPGGAKKKKATTQKK